MSAVDSAAKSRLRALFRRLALAAAALTFVVIVASAFMRHTQTGLACDDWPACYGRVTAAMAGTTDAPKADAGAAIAPSTGVRVARFAHRLAATGVLALVIGMLLIAWTQKPAWKRAGTLAAAALALAAALAVLGIATPGARLPAITLGNLLGGYLMLALLAATWASAVSGANTDSPAIAIDLRPASGQTAHRSRPGASGWLALSALGLLVAQAALGGMIGAQYALMACPSLGACPGILSDPSVAGTVFNPFREVWSSAGRVVPPADAAALHVLHRVLGIVAAVAALAVAYAVRQTDRSASGALAAGAILAPLAGAAAILALPSLSLTVLHNAAAALTIATLAAVAARR